MKVVHTSSLHKLPHRNCECGRKMPFKVARCAACQKELEAMNIQKKLVDLLIQELLDAWVVNKNGKGRLKKKFMHVPRRFS